MFDPLPLLGRPTNRKTKSNMVITKPYFVSLWQTLTRRIVAEGILICRSRRRMSRSLLLLLLQKLLLRIEGGEGGHEVHDPAQARLQHLHLTLKGCTRPTQGIDGLAISGRMRLLSISGCCCGGFKQGRWHGLSHHVAWCGRCCNVT